MVYGPLYFWYEWTGDSQQAGRDFLCCMGTNHDVLVPPPEMLLRQIETRDGLPGTCSVLLRRAAVDKVGGFEETFPGMYEDEVFFAKIALRFPVYIMSQSLDRYRQHTDSFCARAIRTGEYSMDPTIQNPSRQRFLRWLERHIAASGLDDGTLLRALGVQLRADPK